MAFEALNEKLKNLGKKDSNSEKKSLENLSEFFRKNSFLKYVIPVAIFLIAIAVFLAVVIFKDKGDYPLVDNTTSIAIPTDQTVAVLPNESNVVGTTDPDLAALIKKDPLSADILAKAKYVGYVFYSGSYKVAIVSNGGVNYELTVGDCLGESSWQVTEISSTAITFSSGQAEKTLNYVG